MVKNETKSTKFIPVVGVSGGARIDEKMARDAYEVGRLLAKKGAILVTGGLSGVMEAACQGAVQAGGVTIGILPGEDKSEANPYVQVPIATDLGIARNVVLVQTVDVLIAIDGSYGTLSEIALALNLGKRVVALNSWDLEKAGEINTDLYVRAKDPEDAVEMALLLK